MILHHLKLFKLILLFISIQCLVEANIRPSKTIRTSEGLFKGVVTRTVLRQMEYSSFKGIPYAAPPVGNLRFEPPVKFTRNGKGTPLYQSVFSATKDPNMCAQYHAGSDQVLGNEDCLYLNVYTPEVEFKGRHEKRAVMVWIHGGAFMWNSNNSSKFGPDYLVEKNVVVVAMNYRLGALGFLASDDLIKGNMGLKDQVMALEWVRDNIASFGGDPNKVTIFGESAGAVSVELHRLSPLSQGLFRASIAMSGSPLNPWAFMDKETADDMSDELVKLFDDDLGYPGLDRSLSFLEVMGDNYYQLLREATIKGLTPQLKVRILKAAPVNDIVRLANEMIRTQMHLPFLPTVEKSGSSGAFLTEMPRTLYKRKLFSSAPHIIGYTSDEFMGIKEIFYYVYAYTGKTISDATEPIVSEQQFFNGIDQTLKYIKKKEGVTVWKYENSFDYPQSLHRLEGINKEGCGHADDVAHIFYMEGKNQPLDFYSDFAKHRERIVILWTNFAKFLDVTADTLNIENIRWPPVEKNGYYLEFDKSPRLVELGRTALEEFIEDSL